MDLYENLVQESRGSSVIKLKRALKKEIEEPVIRYVMRCQGERLYLNQEKDCDNCEHRFFCYTHRTNLYIKADLVFADDGEDAEVYFKNGFGTKIRLYEMNLEEYERILDKNK